MNVSQQRQFLLRRLQSLLGVIPVGAFLFEHLYTNSYAIEGRAAYMQHANELRNIPFLFAAEICIIGIPILLHAALGVWLMLSGSVNVGSQNWFRNWMYVGQRVSGIILLAFIGVHVWTTRFSGQEDLFGLMKEHLANPYILAFYILGVVSATYHLSNGLWEFGVRWGITITPRAQRISTYACAAIFVILSFVGVTTLFGFNNGPITLLGPIAH